MKNPTLLLIAVLTATICCIPVSGWSQETTAQAVAPDTGPAAAVELTEEEHELLVRLKGERANPYEVRTQPDEAQNAGESGKTRRSLVEEIEALDKVLSKASQVKTGETSRLLMGLMGAAEPAVRMTTLNWLVGRSDVMMEALGMGLRDKDHLVRTVAAQLLLDRGISEEALHGIQEVAEVDPAALDQVLRNSFRVE